MNKLKILLAVVLSILVVAVPMVSAGGSLISFIIDNFSSSELNLDKWREVPGSDINNIFLDEHGVQNGVYHTANLIPSDKGSTLEMNNRVFKAGDIIEYDIYYNSGEGNRISVISIDESTKWWGVVGFWNGAQPAGNTFGKYHVKVVFTSNGVDVFVTNPEGIKLKMEGFPQVSGETHTLGFGTRTGHNGVVHMDYDNVKITKKVRWMRF